VRAHQGNWQPQFLRIVIRLELNTWNLMEQCKLRKRQHNSRKTEKLNSQATEQASLLTVVLPCSFLVSAVNFVFIQLTEQEPGVYDKCHTDYARQDKTDLAWKIIFYEIKESGSCCVDGNFIIIRDTHSR
jgi:uncharacterized protein YcgI (DUF1989 family)